MPSDLSQAVHGVGLTLSLAGGLFVPGIVALALTGHRARGVYRLALAPGISVALWPLALLWTTIAGGHWSPLLARVVMAVLVAAAAWLLWRSLWSASPISRR